MNKRELLLQQTETVEELLSLVKEIHSHLGLDKKEEKAESEEE